MRPIRPRSRVLALSLAVVVLGVLLAAMTWAPWFQSTSGAHLRYRGMRQAVDSGRLGLTGSFDPISQVYMQAGVPFAGLLQVVLLAVWLGGEKLQRVAGVLGLVVGSLGLVLGFVYLATDEIVPVSESRGGLNLLGILTLLISVLLGGALLTALSSKWRLASVAAAWLFLVEVLIHLWTLSELRHSEVLLDGSVVELRQWPDWGAWLMPAAFIIAYAAILLQTLKFDRRDAAPREPP